MKSFILLIFLCLFPAFLSAVTIEDIRTALNGYRESLGSLKADFTIKTSGTGEGSVKLQKGIMAFSQSNGMVLTYKEPLVMVLEMRTNGDLYLNGKKSPNVKGQYQMGDIFLLYYLDHYSLAVDKEDANFAYGSGFEKPENLKQANYKKVLSFTFDKRNKVINWIRYSGNGYDYPYDLKVSYLTLEGIPVSKELTVRLSGFSMSVDSKFIMENIEVVKK